MEAGTVHEPPRQSSLHEGSDIRLRGLVKFALGFAVAGAAINLIVWWAFVSFRTNENRREEPVTGVAATSHIPTPGPRLQPSVAHNGLPAQDLNAMRERERAEFARRGWIVEKSGTVQIPEQIAAQVAQLSQQRPATQPAQKVR
jgi:hypothetical protein